MEELPVVYQIDGITLTMDRRWHDEFLQRYEEASQEFPGLTMDKFCSWGMRYYLEHAFKKRTKRDLDAEIRHVQEAALSDAEVDKRRA